MHLLFDPIHRGLTRTGLRGRLALFTVLACLLSLPFLSAITFVILTTPSSELMRAVLLVAGLFLVWTCAAAFAASRWLARAVIDPLRRLEQEVETNGVEGPAASAAPTRPDEIGGLERALDAAAVRRSEREAERAGVERAREEQSQCRVAELEAQVRALKESEAWHRTILRDQSEIILRCGPDGKVTFANEACVRSFGGSPSHFADLFQPPDWPGVQSRWPDLVSGPSAITLEQCVAQPDGRSRWLQWTLRGIPDDSGRIGEVAASATDITDRKAAEEALLHLNAELEARARALGGELERAQLTGAAGVARLEKLLASGPVAVCNRERVFPFPIRPIGQTGLALLGHSDPESRAPDFWLEQLHPVDRTSVLAGLERAMQDGAGTLEYRFRRADGRYAWLRDSLRLVRNGQQDEPELVSTLSDITSQKRAEQMLADNQARQELLGRAINDGLWDWDLRTNRVYYSARWKSMLGHEENEIGDTLGEWHNRVHSDDIARLQADIDAHLRGRTPALRCEYRILHADGSYRWAFARGLVLKAADASPVRFLGSQTDITALKNAEEQLLHGSLHEPLTGLPNRALFIDRLEQVLWAARSDDKRLAAVLLIDLDRFKVVNDSLGHSIGDELLIAVSRRLESCLRPRDAVARLGGDEFAVLLDPIAGLDDATRAASRIQRAMEEPFPVSADEITLSASIGIALTRSDAEPAESAEAVLRDADNAMYRAKEQGRGRHEVFHEGMHTKALALLRTEGDLRRALERDELRLYYQPIFSIGSCETAGAEALIRWEHPERGLLPPAQFMDVAEETGLIEPMGEWILRTACEQARAWRAVRYPRMQVAVNFSARQFQNPNLPRLVEQVLHESGLEPRGLELEITETTAMQDPALSNRILHELAELGVEISIDDFGNRYSALGRLQTFPVKILKIDQAFLQNIARDPNNAALTTAIIAMARSMNLRVIAEGVETEAQLRFLVREDCDEIQGYMFGRPLPPDALSRLLPTLPEKLIRYVRREEEQ